MQGDFINSFEFVPQKMKITLEWKESILGITEDPNTVRILLISEPWMYKLVFKSRKPEAEKFSDWVVSEVLPTIRKTWSYWTTKSLSPMMMRFGILLNTFSY